MKILTIIPLAKGAFSENLTYFSAKDIASGSIVDISLRNKKILGLVVSSQDVVNAKSDIKDLPFNLKKIIEEKKQSVFSKNFLEAAIEISKYFAVRKNDAVTALLPATFRENYDKISKFEQENIHTTPKAEKNIKPEKFLFQAPLEDRLMLYKTLIRESFAEKKSVFMVLPTEYDVNIFQESLGRGIENFTFSIYGDLSPKKQIEQFKKIVTSKHPVFVLSTAQFLSIPRDDLGTIILEHESSNAYKTMSRPNIDLRTFVELLAVKTRARLIMGDTLLRFETISRRNSDGFSEIEPLSFRLNQSINILSVNIKEKKEEGENIKFKILKNESVEAIEKTISKGENVFIFSLRKGLATMTVCKDCGDVVMCNECSAPVVLYLSKDKQKRIFACNRCKKEMDTLTTCGVCNSWNLVPLGIGTDTVLEETRKTFPKVKIFKLDKESVKTNKDAKKIIEEFEASSGSILIGTEMVFFYLKNKPFLSVIASIDSLWGIPNFRISERILGLLLTIVNKTKNKVIIQTKNENDPAIEAIKSENLSSFVKRELEDRRQFNYPPFKRFIKISHLGDLESAQNAKKIFEEIFSLYEPQIFSGFVPKLKGKYSTNALIKVDPDRWSLPQLSEGSSLDHDLLNKLSSLSPEFSVNVDPEDLL